MIGMLQPAGGLNRQPRPDAPDIADYFAIDRFRLSVLLKDLETGPRPQLLLLQNPASAGAVRAAIFMSSVWSQSYRKLADPFSTVYRDFHYQCFFSGMHTLSEVGCTHIRVENPLTGYVWQKDAYICLLEARHNIKRHVNPAISIALWEGACNEAIGNIDKLCAEHVFEDHRPIGINPRVQDGLNIQTIFVESRAGGVAKTSPTNTQCVS